MATALRKNGAPYNPRFIDSIDPEKCIGCGRCFKVCGEGVFTLVDRADLELENDEYDDEGAMVMVVKNDGNCIGCSACERVCPKNCHVYAAPAA